MSRRIVPSQIVEYLDTRFPTTKKPLDDPAHSFEIDWNYGPEMANLIWMLDSLPEHLITLTGQAAAEFGEAKSAVWLAVERWKNGERGVVIRYLQTHGCWNPLSILRKHLAVLKDEGPEPATTQLTFITDADLRETLRDDLGSVERSFDAGEWKAATVMAGSVLEALLHFGLSANKSTDAAGFAASLSTLKANGRIPRTTPLDIDQWGLHVLTEMALERDLIEEETGKLSHLAKDFRNLIHPGRAIRLAVQCDRGTAHVALAAVDHAVRDLTP